MSTFAPPPDPFDSDPEACAIRIAKGAITQAFAAISQLPHGNGGSATVALIEAQQALAEARRCLDRWENLRG